MGSKPERTHCSKGHEFTPENTYIYKGTKICKQCRKQYAKDFPDKRRNVENMRKWRKDWRERNPHYHRDLERKKKLGTTPEETTVMMETQNGKCAICEQTMDRPCLDHDHITNVVRELLCPSCNLGIGKLKDDPVIVEKALKYLLKHKA